MIPLGCTTDDPSNCANLRGSLYASNESSTWSNVGIYSLGLPEEWQLGYSANASFGYDNLTMGRPGDGGPSISHQVIEGYAAKDFYIGTFGLSPHAVNISDINNPQPSLLGALAEQNKTPSSSWAYTAGAYNRQPTSFGSLTLGGYDAARFVPNNITFPFGPDTSRDLVIGIQSITTDISTESLLPNGEYAFIDSLVPHIWLPQDACQAFERVFELSYNETAERYYVNDTLHDTLTARNPNITFKLGQAAFGGAAIDIVMPYASFDLSAGPLFPVKRPRTFPLRRAINDSQITLGRAFLQDAYVIADYERQNFSVSQVIHPNGSQIQHIVTIYRPGDEPLIVPQHRGLSKGAIAGIAAAAAVIFLIILSAIIWYGIRRPKARHPAGLPSELDAKSIKKAGLSKLSTLHTNELSSGDILSKENPSELSSPHTERLELLSDDVVRGELIGTPFSDVALRSELVGNYQDFSQELPVLPAEMEGDSLATSTKYDR